MEQNETGCQAPQALILCINNCGFFGTAATMNMCSKCYKDHAMKQEAASSIQSIVNRSSSSTTTNAVEKDSKVPVLTETKTTPSSDIKVLSETEGIKTEISPAAPKLEETKEIKAGPTRCTACKKRVGLTGFDCRCGNIFCSVHRYSEKHECPFDYRSAGKDAICKANPVVRGEKLDKM